MEMYFLLMAVCCGLSQASEDLGKSWRQWKNHYNKQYEPREEGERKMIWERNLKLVEKHNNRPGVSFTMEMNKFADQDSLTRRALIKKVNHEESNEILVQEIFSKKWSAPAAFDWRTKGVVTPVIDQGPIGDVVPIVIAECVESYYAIKVGPLFNLSIQEVGDCCTSGILSNATFGCIHDIGGLCRAADYKHSPCKSPTCTQVAKVDGGAMVKHADETALQMALLKTPVFVAIDASHPSFEMYQSGVYNEPQCSSTLLDHALQLVGYGIDSTGVEYWICKNSWGENWGMSGYVLMSRNKGNQCGIATFATYPI